MTEIHLRESIDTNDLIENSLARLEIYRMEGLDIPTVIESGEKTNRCYTTSFLTQYFSYVKEEVLKSSKYSKPQKLMARYLIPLVMYVAKVLKTSKIAWVNNSLLSTPLYSSHWNHLELEALAIKIAQNHPGKAIAFRGVDRLTNAEVYEKMRALGCIPVMGRQVYIFDPKTSKYRKKRSFQQDKKLAEKQDKYYWTTLNVECDKEIERVLELYRRLYLDKHSVFNPIYTKAFVQEGFFGFQMKFEVLKDKSTDLIVAVQGIQETETVINTSFIGYDQSLPRETGLYRMMNYEMMRKAIEKQKILNMSSGSGEFKSKRGGVASFEYQMIYPGNMSDLRLKIWKTIGKALEGAAQKQMQDLKI